MSFDQEDPAYSPRLLELEELIVAEAVPRGFVSRRDAGEIRTRHIEDCLRAVALVEESDRIAIDLGSGAGLPGLVVAIARPNLSMILAERDQAKAAFLELAVERLGLGNVTVFAKPAEDIHAAADLCFARAFAPLPRSWSIARRLLRVGGRLIYFGGARFDPRTVPEAVLVPRPRLASTGPLVIMTR